MLELQNVSWKLENGEEILKDISLTVKPGKLTVITGPNGGGKTTIAKLIAGIETPTSGKIIFDGEDITNLDTTMRAKKGISYAFQQPVRFKGITVRDLLKLSAGEKLKEADFCELLGNVGLCTRDYINREVNSSLSGGEIKRIEIATILARDTKLSVFDEPEAGIDLWSFKGLIEVFEKQKTQKNRSMLVISHQERILKIADEIIVVANGKVRTSGTSEQILPELLRGEAESSCPINKEVF